MTAPTPGGIGARPASATAKRLLFLLFATLVATAARAGDVTVLRSGSIPDALIVGRAGCGRATWLLTDARMLIRITIDGAAPVVRTVAPLRRDDRPWGLACLDAGTLWTLADSRVLARIDADGHVVERVSLPVPWVALFGWKDRLVYAAMPFVVASPVLVTAPPSALARPRAWPPLIVRASAVRSEHLVKNLVACGLPNDVALPCWFADTPEVAMSDGVSSRVARVAANSGVDRSAPVWDVAMAAPDRLWVLFSAGRTVDGRRVGRRLQLLGADGRVLATPQVSVSSRLIVAAAMNDCFLLTTQGAVVRVSAP